MKGSILCVGSDIHLDKIVLGAVDKANDHEVIKAFRVTANLPRAEARATVIVQVAANVGDTRLQIGSESTGILWIPFHRYLTSCPQLQPFASQFVCFNPQLVSKFKEGLVFRKPKHDERDAFDLAARLRIGELLVSYLPSDLWQGLRRLTRYSCQLTLTLSRKKVCFQSYAFL
jgi:hypothetical protein